MVNNGHIPEFKRGAAWLAHDLGLSHREIS
jgi:hypothetical protein